MPHLGAPVATAAPQVATWSLSGVRHWSLGYPAGAAQPAQDRQEPLACKHWLLQASGQLVVQHQEVGIETGTTMAEGSNIHSLGAIVRTGYLQGGAV
jgi:hypothetical protein